MKNRNASTKMAPIWIRLSNISFREIGELMSSEMKHLIIGMGEVGRALQRILRDRYEIAYGLDTNDPQTHGIVFDCIHICFPYSEDFISQVRGYIINYLKSTGLCIIHSTVPIGTSDLCGAVHSPIRGQHPNLEKGIRTFTKYFGGKRAGEAAAIFNVLLPSIYWVDDARTIEALKLWDTAQYAWNILLEKEIHKWCEENKVDFELVYTHANETYNKGYNDPKFYEYAKYVSGCPKFMKYVLDHMPGPIGGHCLIPNARLLDSDISKWILEYNAYLRDEEGKRKHDEVHKDQSK